MDTIEKRCGVCGDRALGYNFNALTCESCKAFFRRNALRNKVFRCITAGNCVLNPKTRKYCRKCRLDKCFAIGMKKDWILTEEEKVMKRRKHRNRDSEKKDADSSSMTCISSDDNHPTAATCTSSSNHNHNPNTTNNNNNNIHNNSNNNTANNDYDDDDQNHNNANNTNTSNKSYYDNDDDDDDDDNERSGNNRNRRNRNNIIILPILPLSLSSTGGAGAGGHNNNLPATNSDLMASLREHDIIGYINRRLNLSIENATIETIGQSVGRSAKCSSSSSSSTETTNSTIIVLPSELPIDGTKLPAANLVSPSQLSSNDNSNSRSLSPSFGSTTVSGSMFDNSNNNNNNNNNSPQSNFSGNQTFANSTMDFIGADGTTKTMLSQQFGALPPSNGTSATNDIIEPPDTMSVDAMPNPNHNPNHNQNNQHQQQQVRKAPLDYGQPWKISDNVYKHAIQLEYTTNPLNSGLIDSIGEGGGGGGGRSLRKLNNLEENRLDEVKRHLLPLCAYVHMNKENKKFITTMAEGLQCFEHTIKKIIIAVKNIQSFKCMCQDDQIALLKGSVGEIKGLLNIRYFNPTQELFIVPNPSDQNSIIIIDHSYLKEAYGEVLYNRCKNFVLSFRSDWIGDDSIINLMAMILLFYPNRSSLRHREYIMLEYLTYCHLLQRYLEVKYNSVCEAKTIYLNLMSRLEEMHDLNEQCMELILKLADPKYIGPLTVELYDLNHKLESSQSTITSAATASASSTTTTTTTTTTTITAAAATVASSSSS